jgi:hypothetical protein
VFIIQLIKKTNSTKWYWILLVYLVFFILLGLAKWVPQIDDNGPVPDVDPQLFSGSLWQWVGFVNILIWFVNLYLILPGSKQIKPKENMPTIEAK